MGSPKALLPFRGRPFLENIIETAKASAADLIMVAVSPNDDKINAHIDLAIATVVVNHNVTGGGPLESIQVAIRSLINQKVEYLLVWPVDLPHVKIATIQALIQATRAGQPEIVVPLFGGRRGHPVFFSKTTFPELLAAPADQGARAVVKRLPDRVVEIAVDDAAVTDAINTPADYQRLLKSLP
jgi:molybdenum cofactor cytidylyltransferase